MALVSLNVSAVIIDKRVPTNKKDSYGWHIYKNILDINPYYKLKKEDTYMIVFGPHQEERLDFFEKSVAPNYNVLFKSKKACNRNHRGTGPRNTLFIFEVKDDAQISTE